MSTSLNVFNTSSSVKLRRFDHGRKHFGCSRTIIEYLIYGSVSSINTAPHIFSDPSSFSVYHEQKLDITGRLYAIPLYQLPVAPFFPSCDSTIYIPRLGRPSHEEIRHAGSLHQWDQSSNLERRKPLKDRVNYRANIKRLNFIVYQYRPVKVRSCSPVKNMGLPSCGFYVPLVPQSTGRNLIQAALRNRGSLRQL